MTQTLQFTAHLSEGLQDVAEIKSCVQLSKLIIIKRFGKQSRARSVGLACAVQRETQWNHKQKPHFLFKNFFNP